MTLPGHGDGIPYNRPTEPAKGRIAPFTEGIDRAPARAMLKAIGFTDDDLTRPIIGVGSTWIETMPCNFSDRIAIDIERWTVDLLVEPSELAARRRTWRLPLPRSTKGVMGRYAAHVRSASKGAILGRPAVAAEPVLEA